MAIFIPTFIMAAITLGFVSVLMIPVIWFQNKNPLVNFYWQGFWIFLILIAGIAGGSNSLMLAGVNVMHIANAVLTGIVSAFVVFVMFAWFRLSGAAVYSVIKRWRQPSSKAV